MKINCKVIASIAGGFAGGFLAATVIAERKLSNPDRVLKQVKKKFRELGHVDGTWMVMKPEKFHNGVFEFDVYQGGVSIVHEEGKIKYEFIADAKTGTILAVAELAEDDRLD